MEAHGTIGRLYLDDAVRHFLTYKSLAEKAAVQVDDAAFFASPDSVSNSIAVIVKHMAGNMRSRWTEFLTADGEKPSRDRDSEFVTTPGEDRKSVLNLWEEGWRTLFEALSALAPEDLDRTVLIRGEPHTVLQAINRQLTHYAYHVGQIVFLAKQETRDGWQSLSIPRGRSREFHEAMRREQERQKSPPQ